MARKLPHVLLLVDTSRSYGRGLIRGVARYNQEHGRWSIYFKPHALDAPPPAWLRESRADGILARIGDRRMAQAILACGVPAVTCAAWWPGFRSRLWEWTTWPWPGWRPITSCSGATSSSASAAWHAASIPI